VEANEQPLPDFPDEDEVAFEPEPGAFDPDGDAAPLVPAEVVPALPVSVAPEPVPAEAEPAVAEPLVTPEVDVPLPAPEEVAEPLDAPLAEPVEASSGAPPPSAPPPPESDGSSVPPSTGVVAMPVAPQKTRIAPLVLVTVTPVRMAGAGLGVISIPSIVWPVGSRSVLVLLHLPVFVTM
jgi:hypothetical protein